MYSDPNSALNGKNIKNALRKLVDVQYVIPFLKRPQNFKCENFALSEK